MFIKSIVLDGFKSYGQRTVIEGFDCEFNAITGLNGTGKSNILDSICFVLGITQLSNVRVTSLQDLIYKSGQTGVTKATVSITFDNTDKNNSPVGFQDYPEITVTRQVVMGGKNKYLINGVNVQNKRVQDLFCSVQLNVNNPHFLIMQGRITKVLNMKPIEILSMIEEATGTKMYEMKKISAEKSIEKKDAKIKEMNEIINEELMPKLTKLRDERNKYREYQKIETEIEHLTALYMAWQFIVSKRTMKDSLEKLQTEQEEMDKLEENIKGNKQKAEEIDEEIKEYQNKDKKINEEMNKFEVEVKEKEKVLANNKAAEKAAKNNVADEEKKKKQLLNSLKDDEVALKTKEAEIESIKEEFQKLKDSESADQAAFLAAQKKYEALLAGMEIGDDGQVTTLQEQLMKMQQEATEAATEIKVATMRLQHNETQLKEKETNLGAAASDYKNDKITMDNMEKDLKKLTNQLENLNFDENKVSDLRERKQKLTYECRGLKDAIERFEARYRQINFQYCDPEPNFNRRSVKGLVCKLITLKDKKFATALETAAGSKLFSVVTDTELTGKKLLQKGQLQNRVSIIPLNKITGNPISLSVVKYAQSLVGEDNVYSALDLIEYNNELTPAMEFIFGSVFICRNINVAKQIAFDKKILRRCVTFDGDEVNPAGTLSGGANTQGLSFLLQLDQYKEYQTEFSAKQQELSKIDIQIQNFQRIAERYNEVKHKYDLTTHELTLIENRLKQTCYYQQKEEISALKKSIDELNNLIKINKGKEKSCLDGVRKIEMDIKNSKSNKEDKLKFAQNEVKELKNKFEKCKNSGKAKQEYYESLKLEIVELQNAIKSNHEQIKICDENIIELQKKYEEASSAANKAKESASVVLAELKEKKKLISSKNEEIQKRLKEKSNLLEQVTEMQLQIQKKSYVIKELENKCQNFKTKEKELKQKIKDNDPRLKDAETMTDVQGHELGKRIARATEHKKALSRTVNVNAQILFDQEENQYQALLKKKNIVENERKKLINFISDMDKRKITFLKTASDQISKDFGSIFRTLLPGTNAILSPPPNKTLLEGLEIKVCLGEIWKENLSELSGGQKSLIALSLILAMLLFKPAPIYILDEVDAALDLSHTQNIGKMLKKHFKQSQFIIVSLKDGMFNNANVLFRTKFEDGVSVVSKTVNENVCNE